MLAFIKCRLKQWTKQQRAMAWGYHVNGDLGEARCVAARLVTHQSIAGKGREEGGGKRATGVGKQD